MKRNFVLSLFVGAVAVSPAAFAQDAQEVLREAERTVRRLEHSLYRLDRAQLSRIDRLLQDINLTLVGRDDPRRPDRPDRPGRRGYVLAGAIEDRYEFNIAARDAIDVVEGCLDAYSQHNLAGQSVDEIEYRINFGDELRLYNNSTYWKTASTTCAALAGHAVENGIPSAPDYGPLIVLANLEDKAQFDFVLRGRSPVELNRQCVDQVSKMNPGNVDEIFLSINGSALDKIYNRATYWKTSTEICSALMNKVLNP